MIAVLCARILKEHKNHFTFRYCLHKSPMREAGASGLTEMLDLVIFDRGSLPGDAGRAG